MAGFSIQGLMSNLDTTKIVNAIIESESGTVNQFREKQTETTNIVTTYKSISAVMLALKTSVAPLTSRAGFDLYSLAVSDDSILTATATTDAVPGTYTLNVDALARNHQIASQGFEDTDTTSIGTGTVQISLGDGSTTTLTIDSSNDTLTGLKNAINQADIGIRATIVDDGTTKNPYRLVLTADQTGKANRIHFTTSLTGGVTPNLATAVFDDVEADTMSTESTATISKGPTAAYSGNQNKTYTFAVGGAGVQTVGSGDITLNWTDGTNSGTLVVSEADTEVALTGAGADGLKLTFGAGALKGGDTFTVQAFAPTLQVAADAQISLGSTAGGGSPILISSATNEVDNLIAGVTLNLKAESSVPVTVTVARDKQAIKDKITAMLDKYNEVMRNIDKQFAYDSDTKKAGVLIGDGYLMSMQSSLRSAISGALNTLPASMNMLASVGIKTGDGGLLMLTDTDKLFKAIDDNFNGVKNLFTNSGASANPLIEFLSATTKTKVTSKGYDVDITQAATQGFLMGTEIYSPATQPITIDGTNNALRLTVDGVTSGTITLAQRTYTSADNLVQELQTKINADENIGKYHLTAEWVSSGAAGYVRFVSPSYGATSQVSLDLGLAKNAYQILGLANSQEVAGKNVEGTINGEPATGSGRVLTGNDTNANTAGLKLVVNLSESDLKQEGVTSTVTFAEGFAARLDRMLASMTDAQNGMITRRTKGLENQATYYADIITDYEARLAERRDKLTERYNQLETTLNDLKSQGDYLTSQLDQISSLYG